MKNFEGYVFIRYGYDGDRVIFKIPSLELTHQELAQKFTDFLRASGYVFDEMADYRLVSEPTTNSEDWEP